MQNLDNQNFLKRKLTDEVEPPRKKLALDLLSASSVAVVKFLVDTAEESTLAETLKRVEAKLKITPNNELRSDIFLNAIVCMLKRYKLLHWRSSAVTELKKDSASHLSGLSCGKKQTCATGNHGHPF